MPSTSSQKSVFDHLEFKIAGYTVDSLGRKWDPAKHPRDSHGRFIETGGIVRAGLGGLGKVVRSLLGGQVEVQLADGSYHIYPHQQLTMVRRPDGSKPTASVEKVLHEDHSRHTDANRGDGRLERDLGGTSIPHIDPHDEHVDNPDDSTGTDAPEAYTPSRTNAEKGDVVAINATANDGRHVHMLARVESTKPDGTPDKVTLAGESQAKPYDQIAADARAKGATHTGFTVIPKEDMGSTDGLLHDAAENGHPSLMDSEVAADLVEGHANDTTHHDSGSKDFVQPEDLFLSKQGKGLVEYKGKVVGRIAKDPQNGEKWVVEGPQGFKKRVASWDNGQKALARHLSKLHADAVAKRGAAKATPNRPHTPEAPHAPEAHAPEKPAEHVPSIDSRNVSMSHVEPGGLFVDKGKIYRTKDKHDNGNGSFTLTATDGSQHVFYDHAPVPTEHAVNDHGIQQPNAPEAAHTPTAPQEHVHTPAAPQEHAAAAAPAPAQHTAPAPAPEQHAGDLNVGDRVNTEYGQGDVTQSTGRSVSVALDNGDTINVQKGTPGYQRIEKVQGTPAHQSEHTPAEHAPAEHPAEHAPGAPKAETPHAEAPKPARHENAPESHYPENHAPEGANSHDTQPVHEPRQDVLRDVPAEQGGDAARPGEVLPAEGQGNGSPAGQSRAGAGRSGQPERGLSGEGRQADHRSEAGRGEGPRRDALQPEAGAGHRGQGASRPADSGRHESGVADHRPVPPRSAARFVPHSQDDLAPKGEFDKAQANVAAVKTLRQIMSEDRAATPEEQKVLARWGGWGAAWRVFEPQKYPKYQGLHDELRGMLSDKEWKHAEENALNAHYTDASYVDSIWNAVEELGFDGGRVLEPGSGAGTFMGFAPKNADMYGVELDPTSAHISRLLYPDSHVINQDFAETRLPDNSFDLTIGNVPFGKITFRDRETGDKHKLHNGVIVKSLRKTRPGGLVAVLTSHHTMDAHGASGRKAREDMAKHGDLIGAVRLPSKAHERAAGTDVVTDLLIFRKREEGTPYGGLPFVDSHEQTVGDAQVPINDYFTQHPEHVLGHYGVGGLRANELQVHGNKDATEGLTKALHDIVAKADEQGMTAQEAKPEHKVEHLDLVNPAEHTHEGFIGSGEKVYERTVTHNANGTAKKKPVHQTTTFTQVENGVVKPFWVSGDKQKKELSQLTKLRDLTRALLDEEGNSQQDTPRIEALRRALNDAYDKYVKDFGPINRFTWARTGRIDPETGEEKMRRNMPQMGGFRDDPASALVYALEKFDPETQTASKASIFKQRTVSKREIATHADTPQDAVNLSMETHGKVMLADVAKALGVSQEQAREQLKGLVFTNPDGSGDLIPRAEYLSGNVRQKLKEAKAAAEDNPALYENVAALESVVPQDLTAGEIDGRMGAAWIGEADVQQFLQEILRDPSVKVEHAGGNVWKVAGNKNSTTATDEWGTTRKSAIDIAEKLLTGSPLVVEDTIKGEYGEKDRRVVNPTETTAAQEKAEEMQDRFSAWLWEDPQRAQRLQDEYNDKFNGIVLREYDTSELTLPGMSSRFTLRPHQNAAVRRIVSEPSAMLAHEVGAGKTLEMVAGAMELRRLGMARKPAIVVPNHMLEQFSREFLEAYPNANILAAGTDDLKAEKRRRFVARAATGDWDAVVLTQGAFQKIGMSKANQEKYLNDQIATLREQLAKQEARGERNSMTFKELQKTLKNREEKIKEKLEKLGDDTGVEFEHTGIDYLMVDEAHMYKNLGRFSNRRDLAIEGSDKATDLDMKVDYLRQSTPTGRVVTFATATPIANSIGEAYTMQQYLRPDLLHDAGIHDFDTWVSTFGTTVNEMEVAPQGGFRMKERFKKFRNVPELLKMFRVATDVKTAEDLNLPVPSITNKGDAQNVIIPASDEFVQFNDQALADAAEDDSPAAILKYITKVSQGSLDMRLVGEDGPPDKLRSVAQKIAEIHDRTKDRAYPIDPKDPSAGMQPVKGSLQIVFSDTGTPNEDGRFSAYDGLRDMLSQDYGIPRDRIRFIHEANNDQKKAELFNDCRSGKVSVLIGSTAKMGVGTNVQDRAVALHHLDCPWRPADLQQREGRVERQGNLNGPNDPSRGSFGNGEGIELYRYMTEGSIDAYRWQTVKDKSVFIGQMMRGKLDVREIDDLSDQSMSLAVATALSAGNPHLLEKARTDEEVKKLTRLDRKHHDSQRALEGRETQTLAMLAGAQRNIAALDEAAPKVQDVSGDNFAVEVAGRGKITKRTDAGEALSHALAAVAKERLTGKEGEKHTIGQFGGFPITAQVINQQGEQKKIKVALEGVPGSASDVSAEVSKTTGGGVLTRLENRLVGIPARRDETQRKLEALKDELGRIRERKGMASPYTEQLADVKKKADLLGQLIEVTENANGGGDKDARQAKANELMAQVKKIDAKSEAAQATTTAATLSEDNPERRVITEPGQVEETLDDLGLIDAHSPEAQSKTVSNDALLAEVQKGTKDETLKAESAGGGEQPPSEPKAPAGEPTPEEQPAEEPVHAPEAPAEQQAPGAPAAAEPTRTITPDEHAANMAASSEGAPAEPRAKHPEQEHQGTLDMQDTHGDENQLTIHDGIAANEAEQKPEAPAEAPKPTPRERRAAMLADYENGATVQDLAKKYGGSPFQADGQVKLATNDLIGDASRDNPGKTSVRDLKPGDTIAYGNDSTARVVSLDQQPAHLTSHLTVETADGKERRLPVTLESHVLRLSPAEAQAAEDVQHAAAEDNLGGGTHVAAGMEDAEQEAAHAREEQQAAEEQSVHERAKEAADTARADAIQEGATKAQADAAAQAAAADEATSDADVQGERTPPPAPENPEEHDYKPKTPTQLPGEKFPLTYQQQRVADATVADGKDVLVKAKAGAGKTSTLEAIARRFQAAEPDKKIVYICFNKSVQTEAEGRMPGNVENRTGHSLGWAYVGTDISGKYDRKDMLRRGDELAKFLGINEPMRTRDGAEVEPARLGQAAMKVVDTFANSADDTIQQHHLPESLNDLSPRDRHKFIGYANKLWDDLKSKDGKVAITHDHMRKMWALSKPDLSKTTSGVKRAGASVVFLDEAQDTPPVLAKVIADQKLQKVIVGDSDQAIYGFTGATDYLDTAKADVSLPLTKSWRFGPQVADIGNRFLQVLGSKERVIGAGPESHISRDMQGADAILTRSNGGMIGEILREQEAGRSVGVPKGTKGDMLSLVRSARYLKGEGPAPERMHEDLAPFMLWSEFQKAAESGEDPKLAMLNRIIDQYGLDGLDRIIGQVKELSDGPLPGVAVAKDEQGLRLTGRTFDNLDAIKQAGFRFREVPGGGKIKSGKNKGMPVKAWYATGTPEEQQATLDRLKQIAGTDNHFDVIVSTAHKSKGLEWGRVRIGDDFPTPKENPETGELVMPDPENLRLAYVAVTRAEKELDPGSLAWVYEHSTENGQGDGAVVKKAPEDLPKLPDVAAPEHAAEAAPAEAPAEHVPEAPSTPEAPAGEALTPEQQNLDNARYDALATMAETNPSVEDIHWTRDPKNGTELKGQYEGYTAEVTKGVVGPNQKVTVKVYDPQGHEIPSGRPHDIIPNPAKTKAEAMDRLKSYMRLLLDGEVHKERSQKFHEANDKAAAAGLPELVEAGGLNIGDKVRGKDLNGDPITLTVESARLGETGGAHSHAHDLIRGIDANGNRRVIRSDYGYVERLSENPDGEEAWGNRIDGVDQKPYYDMTPEEQADHEHERDVLDHSPDANARRWENNPAQREADQRAIEEDLNQPDDGKPTGLEDRPTVDRREPDLSNRADDTPEEREQKRRERRRRRIYRHKNRQQPNQHGGNGLGSGIPSGANPALKPLPLPDGHQPGGSGSGAGNAAGNAAQAATANAASITPGSWVRLGNGKTDWQVGSVLGDGRMFLHNPKTGRQRLISAEQAATLTPIETPGHGEGGTGAIPSMTLAELTQGMLDARNAGDTARFDALKAERDRRLEGAPDLSGTPGMEHVGEQTGEQSSDALGTIGDRIAAGQADARGAVSSDGISPNALEQAISDGTVEGGGAPGMVRLTQRGRDLLNERSQGAPENGPAPEAAQQATDTAATEATPETAAEPNPVTVKGTPEYRATYERGWKSGARPNGLEAADRRGEPNAWYDGYHDRAAGRPKWTLMNHASAESYEAAANADQGNGQRWQIPQPTTNGTGTNKMKAPLARSLDAAAKASNSQPDKRALEFASHALTSPDWATMGGPEGQGRQLAELPKRVLDTAGVTRDMLDRRVASIRDLAEHLDQPTPEGNRYGDVHVAAAGGEHPRLSDYLRRYADAYDAARGGHAPEHAAETPAEANAPETPAEAPATEQAAEQAADTVDTRPEPMVNGTLRNDGMTFAKDGAEYHPDQIEYAADTHQPVLIQHGDQWEAGHFTNVERPKGGEPVYTFQSVDPTEEPVKIKQSSLNEVRAVRAAEMPGGAVAPESLRPGTLIAFHRNGTLRSGVFEGMQGGRAVLRDARGNTHESTIGGKVRPIMGAYKPGAEPTEQAFAPEPGIWAPHGQGFAAANPGEWVAGIQPSHDGTGYRWQVQGVPGSGLTSDSGTAATVDDAMAQVDDALSAQALDQNGGAVTLLPARERRLRDEKSRELTDMVAAIRGNTEETPAGAASPAEETAAEAPTVEGQPAGWVPTGELQPGDIARVTGDDGNGSATTRTGHVLGTPEPVEVHQPGKPAEEGHRVTVGEDHMGGGERGTVLAPDDSVAARAERDPKDGTSDQPKSAAESQVLSDHVGTGVPTGANNLGVFPGSVVKDEKGRSGVVSEVTPRDVTVRWAGDKEDTHVRPGLLHVDPEQQNRPEGWTKAGQIVEPGSIVRTPDGVTGTVDRLEGDSAVILTPGGEHHADVADLIVAGQAPASQDEAGYVEPTFDAPASPEGLDVRPTEPVKPEPLPDGVPTAMPNFKPEHLTALNDLGLDTDQVSPLPVQQAAARLRHGMPISEEQARALSERLAQMIEANGVPAGEARKLRRVKNRLDAAAERAHGETPAPEQPQAGEAVETTAADVVPGDVIALPNPATGEAEVGTVVTSAPAVVREDGTVNPKVLDVTIELADGSRVSRRVKRDAAVWRLPDLPANDSEAPFTPPASQTEEDAPFTEPRINTRLEDAAQAVTDAATPESADTLGDLATHAHDAIDQGADEKAQEHAARELETSLRHSGVDEESAANTHDAAEQAAERVAEQVRETVANTVDDAEPLPGESQKDAAERVRERLAEAADTVDYDAATAEALNAAAADEAGEPLGLPSPHQQARARNDMRDALRADLFSFADQLAALGESEHANTLSQVAAQLAGKPDEKQVQRAVQAVAMGRKPSKVRSLLARIRGIFARARRRFLDAVKRIMGTGRKAKRSLRAAIAAARSEWNDHNPEVRPLVEDAAKHLAAGGDAVAEAVTPDEPTGFADRLAYWREKLPESSVMFGHREVATPVYKRLGLGMLRSGRQVRAESSAGYTLDRAADGGPGETALAHMEALHGLGRALDDEAHARVRAQVPDLGDDPAATVREAQRYADEVARDERSNLTDSELADLRKKARADAEDKATRYARALAASTRDLLAEQRGMGPSGAARLHVEGRSSNADEVKALRWAEQFIPTDWLASAGTVEAKAGRMGGYEDNGTITVAPLTDGRVEGAGEYGASALHGLGHHFETTVPGLSAIQWVHHWQHTSQGQTGRRRRIGAGALGWLRDMLIALELTKAEGPARKGDFPNPWMGMEHADGQHFEALPQALAAVFSGSATETPDELRRILLAVLGWTRRTH